ncbi:MAG: hypothetical protein IT386_02845 [Deltaproteobacteria bacterium]|nr:hypothetical protein [Deltaproteobacteria bacterium]
MRNSRRIALIVLMAAVAVSLRVALAPEWGNVAEQAAARDVPHDAVPAAGSAEPGADGRTGRDAPQRAGTAVAERTPLASTGAAAANGAARHRVDTSERGLALAEPQDRDAPHAAASPRLDPVELSEGAVTARVSGWDPAPPRQLTLWRVEDGRFARLAETRSGPDGRFHFAEIAAAGRSLAVGEGDREPDAEAPRIGIAAAGARAPAAQVIASADGPRLRVWPSAQAAALVFAAGGREIGRRALSRSPDARDRMVELPVVPGAPGAGLFVAEQHADGVRSAWTRLDFDAPEEGFGEDSIR